MYKLVIARMLKLLQFLQLFYIIILIQNYF